jgi:hypothetical protein
LLSIPIILSQYPIFSSFKLHSFIMLSVVTLLALAAAVQSAPAPPSIQSVPAPEVIGSTQFTAPAVKNPAYIRNGTAALLKAYAKHNLVPTQEFSAAFLAELSQLKKRQDGSAPATSYQGVEYLVSTTVGGQKLNLDFDTGSADL